MLKKNCKLEEHAAKLQAQQDAVKEKASEAEKKSEIAKHKTLQIKRSIDFLMDTKFILELLDQAAATQGEEVYSAIKKLSAKIDNLT